MKGYGKMTFEEIERQLPSGFHDADLLRIEIDWRERRLVLEIAIQAAEADNIRRVGRVTVTGLVFCSVDAPIIDPKRGYDAVPTGGLSIDTGIGPGDPQAAKLLPKVPSGAFLQWLFVKQWNGFIHICGLDAAFSWIG